MERGVTFEQIKEQHGAEREDYNNDALLHKIMAEFGSAQNAEPLSLEKRIG
jgi:hypothetical protein